MTLTHSSTETAAKTGSTTCSLSSVTVTSECSRRYFFRLAAI